MIRRDAAFLAGRFRPGATGARAVLFLGAAVLALPWGGCAPVGFERGEPAPEPPRAPPLEGVGASAASAREANRLLEEARAALSTGAYEGARAAAREVIRDHPGAPGSGEALEILARSSLALGLSMEAAESAGRYSELLGPAHPLFPSGILLWGQSLAAAGDPGGASAVLLRLPPGSPPEVVEPARELFRQAAAGLDLRDLREAAQEVPEGHPLRGIVLTELAMALHFSGDEAGALARAREALAGPLDRREGELARAILDDRLEEALGRPLILGAILPRSGVPPSLVEYGTLLEEGIQVAVHEFQGDLRRSVRLEVEDDGGLPGTSMESIRKLEDLGAMGVIGLLTQEVLAGAVQGRERETLILSPSVAPGTGSEPGVLALVGPDVSGARALARYAKSAGLQRVVVMRPRSEGARAEASAFREELEAMGNSMGQEVLYDPGATFFRDELTQVARFRPDALFLPLAPHEIELLAPQLTFYGLDTLGIQVLGTSGWASEEVLFGVDPRHTDGVITSASRMEPRDMEAFRSFRDAYEGLHRKTLRSPIPAFGYDAAALLLQAFQTRPRNARELGEALDQIQDFPGATGLLSVEGGRIVRAPRLARIEGRELLPLQPSLSPR
jgi:branched-chain amino acid transport system substrate-binding protein